MNARRICFWLLFLIVPSLCCAQSDSLCVISEFNTPSENPWGLAFDSDNFWVSDNVNSNIYKIDTIGNVIDSIYISNCIVNGIVSTNDGLWIVNDKAVGDTLVQKDRDYIYPFYQIYKIDKNTGTKLDSIKFKGVAVNHGSLWGITEYKSNLYISFNGGWGPCMYEIDPIKRIINSLCCAHPCGLTTIDDTLWSVRFNSRSSVPGPGNDILPVEISEGVGSRDLWERSYDIGFYASDIAYDGENIWLCDRDGKKIKKMSSIKTTPEHLRLTQNYPNPFNLTTTIRYDLPQAAAVSLIVYDLLGREVVRLVDGQMLAASHQVTWNGRTADDRDLPSGIYIARLFVPPQAGLTMEQPISVKMVLLR